jgi:hypothetical protein
MTASKYTRPWAAVQLDTGRGQWQGVVKVAGGRIVARCPHRHLDMDTAQACGAELRRQTFGGKP